MTINQRVTMLRKAMKEKNISAYVVNTADPHISEYPMDRYKMREWISGFTGSAGTAVITEDKALLWTDGRYFIQAENELKSSEYELVKMGIPGYPTYEEWLSENIEAGKVVGFNSEILPENEYESLEKLLDEKDIGLSGEYDFIGPMWEGRPESPKSKAFIHEYKYTGKEAIDKIEEVRDMMRKDKVDYFILASLDDIGWLYNLRGRDIKHIPINVSYALISLENSYLYIDGEKIDEDVSDYLARNEIEVKAYEEVFNDVGQIKSGSSVYVEKEKINRYLYGKIKPGIKIKSGINYTTTLKAIKNSTEIENQKNAYIKDGVALVKFLYWLDNNVGKTGVTELSAANKLREFREEQEFYIEDSFNTISAYKENAAMMHYAVSEDSNKELKEEGLFLVDSGGQYLDGTTDITRTIGLGSLRDEEIRDFTLTLKGHINLASARFLYGATGHSLDVLSRYPLWQEGIDYKCGTGHGIGFMLNVHEGPHRIATAVNSVVLEDGMITSIEPGVYKTGEYGIRIENIVVVKKDIETDSGQFMKFDILSLVPIDKNAIDVSLLSNNEREWLNNYHRQVYRQLSPFLTEEESQWLKKETSEI